MIIGYFRTLSDGVGSLSDHIACDCLGSQNIRIVGICHISVFRPHIILTPHPFSAPPRRWGYRNREGWELNSHPTRDFWSRHRRRSRSFDTSQSFVDLRVVPPKFGLDAPPTESLYPGALSMLLCALTTLAGGAALTPSALRDAILTIL
jgi:hypothetical protein